MNTQKRYLIKKEYEATDKNVAFAGQRQTWIHGKGDTSCQIISGMKIGDYFINNYAYSRLCDAKRALNNCNKSAEWETSYGWWKVSCEIMEV